MSRRSLRASIDAHCRDCGACDAGANWREHVSCCPAVSCPLWSVRPLSRYVPDWLASRDPTALPDGWCQIPLEDALPRLRLGIFRGTQDANMLSCEASSMLHGDAGPKSEPLLSGASLADTGRGPNGRL